MNRLRRIILLLIVALAAVIARMVIDGPKLLGGLAGALIVVLLLCSLALMRQGVRLQPGASSETERVDAADAQTGLPHWTRWSGSPVGRRSRRCRARSGLRDGLHRPQT
jgi:hypothetical protein